MIEYFLGLDTELSAEESEWLEIYRAMPGRDRRYWVEALRAWVSGKNEDE